MGIHLLMQGTWVRSLVWEGSTCHGGTKPMCLEPVFHNSEKKEKATTMRSLRTARKSSPSLPQLEKIWAQQERLSIAKK